ncbi:TIGR02680 family protein [Rugosimonospora acidiphila]|uniref:TIGR02680 family protein n=1 Tax=Rugosimonospora acidiphila TaxID=556531 RepID=A0ABP9RL32_9ACTN
MTLAADPTLTAPGPAASDEQLAAWRDALSHAGLPDPTRTRWQVLRAGVVNLWEFDVAEYWFADGRAQFVGANQSGKSTLMALTTLIMLSGSLDRQYIDTFGQSDKSFRYYVEPTEDARDRRDASASTNRGWAWMEFGRLGPDGPRFLTTLLYAQAKRGVNQLTPTWMVCEGAARVRDGLDLAVGQAVVEPRDLQGVDGVVSYDSGRKYAEKLATDVFGFADADRFATVLEMLKVLRTPHLGQKLNPDWFTAQIRSALPPIARGEVEELAEGWQQLEQLGRDRDDADQASKAIAVYVTKAWRPWADAVLRQHADELLAADDAVSAAGGALVTAEAALGQARDDLNAETANTGTLDEAAKRARAALTQLLRSAAYQDAAGRAANAEKLQADAVAAGTRAQTAVQQLTRAHGDHGQAADAQQRAQTALDSAREEATVTAEHTVEAATAAGLGDQTPLWVGNGDVDRLDAAVAARRGHVTALRRLLRAATTAVGRWQSADNAAGKARDEFAVRDAAAATAIEVLSAAQQQLSDRLERWAAGLGVPAPAVADREAWLREVTDQAAGPRPRQVLTGLLTRQWLQPAVDPLTERIATLRAEARTASKRAAEADAAADQLEQAGEPQPAEPAGWTRRDRPAFPSTHGAPLWRLVDPPADLDPATLDHVEAALAAAGLLDAWVTPDGRWSTDRDGDDAVITTIGTDTPAGATTLSAVLQPAEDAGPLAAAVGRILAGIGYAPAGAPLSGAVAVAGDGRWRTAAAEGRAGRSAHGAELIGAAARTNARRRHIAELRRQAAADRDEAETLLARADELADQATALRAAAEQAPDDAEVVEAGTALAAANTERERAEAALAVARQAAAEAKRAADDATGEATGYATGHHLPTTDDQLDTVGGKLDDVAQAVSGLRVSLHEQATAERVFVAAGVALENAARNVQEADQAARAAASEAAQAREEAVEAAASVDRNDQEQFDRAAELEGRIKGLDTSLAASQQRGLDLSAKASKAEERWEQRRTQQAGANQRREAAATAWWVPVDAGLAAARNLPDPTSRDLPQALAHARAAAQALRPANWPEAAPEKARRAEAALSRALGAPLIELRALLERSGGRSVVVLEADEVNPMPGVALIVDASGTQLSPAAAIRHLDDLVAELSASHDAKLHQMYTELLSSTFVDHLAERLKKVLLLLKTVNQVLERHRTGANRTTLRLRRHPAEGHRHGYNILRALEEGTIESDTAQEQIRLFLGDRLREAQDAGLTGTEDWTDHLATLLDYRDWFDVVAEFRVEGGDWKPLTKQVHSVDSGGGKVVTLLQPLLATLVALYSESDDAPRPLWLDEAFEGVDGANRATMLRMLVEFDLDFLLAGPAPLVAAAQVPAAAVWIISRAPSPAPGVDLSLMLWAGRTLEQLPVPDITARVLTPRRPPDRDTTADLFSVLDEGDPDA